MDRERSAVLGRGRQRGYPEPGGRVWGVPATLAQLSVYSARAMDAFAAGAEQREKVWGVVQATRSQAHERPGQIDSR